MAVPLDAMLATERAFAQRAVDVGWKQAFLDYFADDAVAFAGEAAVPAREGLRQAPDPPAGLQLLWEPRFGDIAASGDLGYLTGPTTTINPARNGGAPRYGNYTSIWRRQADGTYKVIIDVGVNTPGEPGFAPGFTRAPGGRYAGAETDEAAEKALSAADAALNRGATVLQAVGYEGRLADGVRFHRFGLMPVTGGAATAWLATQAPYGSLESRAAAVAGSRDLGYTWGTYTTRTGGTANSQGEKGFYVRVWSRRVDGTWVVAVDVLQPQ